MWKLRTLLKKVHFIETFIETLVHFTENLVHFIGFQVHFIAGSDIKQKNGEQLAHTDLAQIPSKKKESILGLKRYQAVKLKVHQLTVTNVYRRKNHIKKDTELRLTKPQNLTLLLVAAPPTNFAGQV